MDIITWLFVGLVAGLIASFISRDGGFGLIGDILLGMAGAVVGAWGFRELHLQSPINGIGGVILVASIGAIVLLFAIRLLQRARTRRS
jgi:uncharacterized membrane protein YeaQ/YmgE (transglycosylase-associated protein family)